MGGIFGVAGRLVEGNEREKVRYSTRLLTHRGPDGEGYFFDDFVALGCRGFSTIGIAGTEQPICNEDATLHIVCDGRVYNYVELGKQLRAKGHRFKTDCDIECILHLYEEKGIRLLDDLRGTFAFALWDGGKKRLILARDRVGKKPLYYSLYNGDLVFGSELGAILGWRRNKAYLRAQSLYDYLTFGFVPGHYTAYEGVHKLMPGHYYVYKPSKGEHFIKGYWNLDYVPKSGVGFWDACRTVEDILKEAVRLRLRSDVPVGVFLSGGIDSGLITAFAADILGTVNTFSVGFHDSKEFDERPLAAEVAQRYGTKHMEFNLEPRVRDDLSTIVSAYNQPLADSSVIPSYYVAREAAKHVKIVLNGDGGDEGFCGYRRYLAAQRLQSLGVLDNRFTRFLLAAALRIAPEPGWGRTPYGFLHRFCRGLVEPPANRYLVWTGDKLGEAGPSALWRLTRQKPAVTNISRLLAQMPKLELVDQFLYLDFHTILPQDLLVKVDIATMAHSLEARSPFLDHVLLEYAACLPVGVKLSGGETKPLLRNIARRYLPQSVVHAPKRGFEVPLAKWLSGELRGMVHDLLLTSNARVGVYLDLQQVRMLLKNTTMERKRWATIVWTLLWLEIWLQQQSRACMAG